MGGLTSLTGGGGMSAGSSATNGDFGADSSYKVGNMNFGMGGSNNNQLMILGGIALVALLLWKKK